MSVITVRGARARAYAQYCDDAEDVGDVRGAYTDTARTTPSGLDVAAIAIALQPHVRFTETANRTFIGMLDRNEERIVFSSIRSGIEVTATGAAIVAACERAGGATLDRLAEACTLLFIAAHPKLVRVDPREEVTGRLVPYLAAMEEAGDDDDPNALPECDSEGGEEDEPHDDDPT